jgi:hypothetical protein
MLCSTNVATTTVKAPHRQQQHSSSTAVSANAAATSIITIAPTEQQHRSTTAHTKEQVGRQCNTTFIIIPVEGARKRAKTPDNFLFVT